MVVIVPLYEFAFHLHILICRLPHTHTPRTRTIHTQFGWAVTKYIPLPFPAWVDLEVLKVAFMTFSLGVTAIFFR